MKPKKDSLDGLLAKGKAVPKAVATLIRALDAKRTFAQNGKLVTEEDASTQVKAAVALLSWAEGPPVAKAPSAPDTKLGHEEVKMLVREKIVSALCAPGARLGDLVQAEKALSLAGNSEALTPMSEGEIVREARRIHGISEETEVIPGSGSKSADNRTTLA